MKKIEWQWELIDSNSASNTKRVKVLGGWLLIHQTYNDLGTQKAVMSESSVFIQDQHWEWSICEPFVDPKIEKSNLAKDFQIKL